MEEIIEQPIIITEYITVENGIITGNYITDKKLPENAIPVKNFNGIVGEPITYYNEDWTRKSDIELMLKGFKDIPKGYKFNDDKSDIVEMSQVEKIQAGLEELPQGQKIEGGELVPMTDEERLASGQMTQAEYTEICRWQILAELDAIDRKTTRPLRAILAGIGTDEDREKLAELERQAEEKRAELDKLTGGKHD